MNAIAPGGCAPPVHVETERQRDQRPADEMRAARAADAERVPAPPAQADPLWVVAVVSMNGGEALVLNRRLRFIFKPDGQKGYLGADGPFREVLGYSHGSGRFVAFGGAAFPILLEDGTTVTLKDHWWNGHIKGFASPAYGDVESLTRCYVFTGGACIAPDDLAALRATYSGPVHEYREYEKLLKAARAEVAA